MFIVFALGGREGTDDEHYDYYEYGLVAGK